MLEANDLAKRIFPKYLSVDKRGEQAEEFRNLVAGFAKKEERSAEFEKDGKFYFSSIEEYIFQEIMFLRKITLAK